ncbi:MAG: isoamylase early set domain-containing protein [Candidatus Eisenbacteria bacterium]|nr:isoamylase early set domain-containing protein [Candidatus Eisenbacteria bacterium]
MTGRTLPPLLAAALLLAAQASPAAVNAVEGGIEFSYADPYAASVSLAGIFNNWSTNATPLSLGGDGVWRVVVPLGAGKHEYKFVVNGTQWVADPDNPRVVGAYGNSEVEVTADGGVSAAGAASAISNTPLSARVNLSGWYRGSYDTQSDTPSDPRWRLDRPAHELYLKVIPTVTPQVKGEATLRFDTAVGDIKKVSADFYSGHATLEGGPFTVVGFYNEERVQFDDPLELVGHINLPGTIAEEHIPFGRGAQGVTVTADVGPTALTAVYANRYDYDVWNKPTIFDNTDTDLLAARLTSRPLGAFRLGATYASHRDGWWMSWQGGNEDPFLDAYIDSTGSASDWFEYARTEQWIAGDASWKGMSDMLELAAAYGRYSYAGRWDMGNRESVQGDDLGNGAIDVPTGDMKGSYLKGIASANLAELVRARLSVERQAVDGMKAGEEYIAYGAPAWAGSPVRQLTEVRYAGSPLVVGVYGPAPERDDTFVETDVNVTLGIFGLGLEFDRSSYAWEYPESLATIGGRGWEGTANRFALLGRADVMADDLWFELAYQSLTHDFDDGLWMPYDTGELIGRAGFTFRPDWSVVTDLRRVTYRDVPSGEGTTDQSFVNPYLAVVWSPRRNVEVRLGYGVNPTGYADSPVEGRGNGRERWRSQYLWDHSGADEVGAERALEDARVIGLMAVIAF